MTYLIVLRRHLLSKYTDDYEQIVLDRSLTGYSAKLRLKELIEDLNNHRSSSKVINKMRERWGSDINFNDFKYKRWLYSYAIIVYSYAAISEGDGWKSDVIELSLMTHKTIEGASLLDYIDVDAI